MRSIRSKRTLQKMIREAFHPQILNRVIDWVARLIFLFRSQALKFRTKIDYLLSFDEKTPMRGRNRLEKTLLNPP